MNIVRQTLLALVVASSFVSCTTRKQDAQQHFQKGLDLLFSNNLMAAQKEMLASVAVDSTYWKAYYELGGISDMTGDFEGAVRYTTKAIQLNPGFASAYLLRASSNSFLGYEQACVADLDKAISLNMHLTYIFLSKAHIAYKAAKWSLAIDNLTAFIKSRPGDAMAFSLRGNSRYNLGDYIGALNDYEEVIKLQPKSASAYVNKGMACKAIGNYADAIESMDVALGIDPAHATAYLYKGLCEIQVNEEERACEDFHEADKLNNHEAKQYIEQYCK